MAKASELDLENAMNICSALEGLTDKFYPVMPPVGDEFPDFDKDDAEQCKQALHYLMRHSRGLPRVVYGCAVMLDPRNKFVDPAADTIEYATPMANY